MGGIGNVTGLFICLYLACSHAFVKRFLPQSNRLRLFSSVDEKPDLLPVTVLSGFLGAGKTTLLQHILKTDHKGKKYAVIVNDMSELNIDGALVQAHVQQQQEQMVTLSNGCICCTLREDLLKEVASLAKQKKFDHLIIESTGIAEPMPVAETFTFTTDDGKGESLLDLTKIDSMVTVVDAVNFLKDMEDAEDLLSRGLESDENDTRTITDLLVSQVEFASVILINKCDLVTPEQLRKVIQIVRALNADAKIIQSVRSKIDIAEVIGSNSYDFEKATQSAAWIKAINDEHEKVPESEEYGISSFVYRARRPFHPSRLMDFVNDRLGSGSEEDDDDESSGDDNQKIDPNRPCVIRSKGFFWLASRPQEMMLWSQAGGLFQLSPGGGWWADTPREFWPEDEESVAQIKADWVEPDGDRRQELVFIGTNLSKDNMYSVLDSCLLTEKEFSEGPVTWQAYSDPFPVVEMAPEDDEEEGTAHGGLKANDMEGVTLLTGQKGGAVVANKKNT